MIRRLLGLDEKRDISYQSIWGAGADVAITSRSAAGQIVTTETAARLTAVFGAWRLLSEGVATLPVSSMIDWNGTAKPYTPRPAWMDFDLAAFGQIGQLGQGMLSLLSAGNAYYLTPRTPTGEVLYLQCLDPDKVDVKCDEARRSYLYVVDGVPLTPAEVLHIPGMMLPGHNVGMSPIRYARETIGLGLAVQEYGGAFFANGATPGALIEVPHALTDVGVRAMKSAWNEVHRGAHNAHRLAVLTEGAKFTQVSLAPEDAQFIETRQFQVVDIARLYGIPPHLLADASNSTSWGSGLAEQNTAFAQFSLRPWVKRMEAGLTALMRSEARPGRPYARLDMDDLTRGSFQEQVTALVAAVVGGLYNQDEARARLGMGPLPNGAGQKFLDPVQKKPNGMTDVPENGKTPPPPAPPTPPGKP